jgi:hypothetical protein
MYILEMIENKLPRFLLFCFSLAFASGCTVQWTEAIRYGTIARASFEESVELEIQKGLLFVEVRIHDQPYRFLFDSGAPLSISEDIRTEHGLKTVSSGHIIDSDHNRKPVDWVGVDSIRIGGINFLNQTAFVTDFDSNPLLECLNFDGIIGSNLMRHCNWTINQQTRQLTLSSNLHDSIRQTSIAIPFQTDYQFNVFLNIGIGKLTIKNLLMDFGSNGALALEEELFSILQEKNALNNSWLETGVQQTGIVGKPVAYNRTLVVSDSVQLGGQYLDALLLRTGKTSSIGNKILSRFIVSIDWEQQMLYLQKTMPTPSVPNSLGFSIGYTEEKGIYIQSVIEGTPAYQQGIRPDMKVKKVDTLDFEQEHDFCDYVFHQVGDTIFLQWIHSDGQTKETRLSKISFK